MGEQSATGPQRLDLQPPTRLGAPLRAAVGRVLVAVHVAAIKVALRWPAVPLLLRWRAPILVTLWWPSPLIVLWGPVPALLRHWGRPVALVLWRTIVVLPLRGTGIDRGRRCVAVGVVVVGRWSSVLQQKPAGKSEAGRRCETVTATPDAPVSSMTQGLQLLREGHRHVQLQKKSGTCHRASRARDLGVSAVGSITFYACAFEPPWWALLAARVTTADACPCFCDQSDQLGIRGLDLRFTSRSLRLASCFEGQYRLGAA